jgi:glutaredoxin-like protein NrdH
MILLYTKPNCVHCEMAKKYLNQNDIDYEAINVSDNKEALEFLKMEGHKSVPQIYIGRNFIPGGNSGLQKYKKEELLDMIENFI